MKKVVAAIYAVPSKFVSRIFDEHKQVFVKYTNHETSRLVSRNKILFYASQGQGEIVGEATIKAVEFLTPTEALERHGDELFLNREELMSYASKSPSRSATKKMLVLAFSSPKKYLKAIRVKKPLTMAGQYLTEEEYKALFEEPENWRTRV
jgi:hypothetical protein